jgi:hypothetical protein
LTPWPCPASPAGRAMADGMSRRAECAARGHMLSMLRRSTAIRERLEMSERSTWTMHHFSRSTPKGPEQGDVPALLRSVADSIEKLGNVEVYDLILHNEITEDGHWPSVTVYYDYPNDDA